jgi:hypothetical protein
MYVVNKWADELQPGAEASPTIPAQHSMIYVARGSASVNGQGIDADSAIYVEDFAHIKAGKDGATLWRWGIVPRHEPFSLLSGNGVDSELRMSRQVKMFEAKRRQPPSQGWKTFLRNHADAVASIDLFAVPTISFRLLYGFLVLRHSRREILWLGVTAHPIAGWIAGQLT